MIFYKPGAERKKKKKKKKKKHLEYMVEKNSSLYRDEHIFLLHGLYAWIFFQDFLSIL